MYSQPSAFLVFLLLLAAVSTAAKDRRIKIGFLVATIVCAVIGGSGMLG